MLSQFDKILLGSLTLFFSVGLGTTISLGDLQRIAKKPWGLVVGLMSQFLWMPLLASLAISYFELELLPATGLMLMACAPGGGASNMFAYFTRADLALSVAMTTVSTLTAVFATPLLLTLYSAHHEIAMPIPAVAGTIAVMLLPLTIGMWIQHKRPDVGKRVERIGSIAGVLLIIVLILQPGNSPIALVERTPFSVVAACICVSFLGMLLGFAAAAIGRRPAAERRAIAFEKGIQNTPLVISDHVCLVFGFRPRSSCANPASLRLFGDRRGHRPYANLQGFL